ncbi:NADP-binding protein [Dacryopinax primogenitus]|uniref:NADP-binding protein n=1 Tax=Dacryopinax primogenitus (strain DJM 731) TaxID=1858805 RepID=M5G5H3_DACPD|nr:NADP-binding protein [Dacryopinax primogenitus]EJU05506.1 NADP-binding protein [Dacryopinax primogenitus]
MSLLVLSAKDVDAVVQKLTPQELMLLMGKVFAALQQDVPEEVSPKPVQLPHRIALHLPSHTTLFMPSRLASAGGSAMKVVSVPLEHSQHGLPATTMVMDEESGRVRAVVNARSLTAVRTAAGSGLAVSIIGPRNPETLVLFGAGLQMLYHGLLLLRMYPSIRSCTVVNRTGNARLESVMKALSRAFPKILLRSLSSSDKENESAIQDAVSAAHIICSATSATRPLYDSDWVSPGTCIVLAGSYKPSMHEVSSRLVKRASIVVVDSRSACLREAGELIAANLTWEDLVELGDLLDVDGRPLPGLIDTKTNSSGDVTIFKSVGIGLQDVAIANLVVEQALSMGLGTEIDYD